MALWLGCDVLLQIVAGHFGAPLPLGFSVVHRDSFRGFSLAAVKADTHITDLAILQRDLEVFLVLAVHKRDDRFWKEFLLGTSFASAGVD